MKVLMYHTWLTTMLAALLLNMAACQNGSSPNKQNSEPDSLSLAAENQVEAAAETGDITRTIELADSFVNENHLSSVRANFYKALACNRKENYPGMAEYIRKIVKAYEDGSDEDPLFYSRAAISLAGYYISMNQYEEAMNVAMPALARFEPDPTIQSGWKGIFLSFIGACQKKLNQPEEAKKNFEQAYQYYRKYMGEERFKLLDFLTCIVDLYNISMYYASKETLKEEQMWTDRCDSLLSWYRIQPGADSAHVEMMDGVIALRRAHILLDEGEKNEADKAFEAFLKTKYSKGDEGRLIACGYLTKVGRYAEVADIYQDYDRIAAEWGLKPNLDVIKDYLFPKFSANYEAGRKDSALAVAVKIASLIDSAVIQQKDNAATEMTTIYETQKKDRMFVTMFIGRLNMKLYLLEYCNAGHNPPVTGNAGGRFSFLDIKETNAPIGLWPGLEFVGESFDHFKNRLLLIYTDGLNEAENSLQEQLGEERILDLLKQARSATAQQVIETLADAVSQHRNGAEPNDDLTMMCVSLKKHHAVRKEINLKNQVGELERVLQFVGEIGDELGLDDYYYGTGIGLTVARNIARRLGGDIVLDTTYTGGARALCSPCQSDYFYD